MPQSTEIKHLFRKKPEFEFVSELLVELGFTNGLNDTRPFNKHDISLSVFEEWFPLIEPYYLPCKAVVFLQECNPTKVITILRHLIRVHGYKLSAQEKIQNGAKQTIYHIESVERTGFDDLSGNVVVKFD